MGLLLRDFHASWQVCLRNANLCHVAVVRSCWTQLLVFSVLTERSVSMFLWRQMLPRPCTNSCCGVSSVIAISFLAKKSEHF